MIRSVVKDERPSAKAMGKIAALQVDQTLLIYPQEPEMSPTLLDETAIYVMPLRFRSDIVSDQVRRTHLVVADSSLTVIDGRLAVMENPFDRYQRLLRSRTRSRLMRTLNQLGIETAIVRAMPNTPALVQSGATGLFANPQVSSSQRDLAESIMRAAGLVQWVEDEALMDAVTALSGSGPAYIFLVMEAMEKAAQKLGLPAETARLLTVQTAFGAAKLALEIEEDPALLRENVTSPGGTTERAIQVLLQEGLEDIFSQALRAARDRSQELADELSK